MTGEILPFYLLLYEFVRINIMRIAILPDRNTAKKISCSNQDYSKIGFVTILNNMIFVSDNSYSLLCNSLNLHRRNYFQRKINTVHI